MIIQLEKEQVIITQPEVSVTTDSIFVNQFTDTGTSVEALITIGDAMNSGQTKTIMLWEGEEYTKAGQYSDDMVAERIKELI